MANFRGLLIAAALGAAAAGTLAAEPALTSDQFAGGWQEQAHPLFNQGSSKLDASKTVWYVPQSLPAGRYVLVQRDGEKAEVIDGYGFEIHRGDGRREIRLFLSPRYGNVEALPIDAVPALAALPFRDASR
jgi:hypothetical protein